MILGLAHLAANPKFWEIVGITLIYCGAIALFAMLGERVANRLQEIPTDTTWHRLQRSWMFWLIPSGLLFYACIGAALANAVILAALLVIPYAFCTSVGIYREGRA